MGRMAGGAVRRARTATTTSVSWGGSKAAAGRWEPGGPSWPPGWNAAASAAEEVRFYRFGFVPLMKTKLYGPPSCPHLTWIHSVSAQGE